MKFIPSFGRYASVSVLSAASDWVVFSILVSVVGVSHLPSLMTARIVGGVVSFLSNRNWTWGHNRQIAVTQQGRRFLVLYAFSYLVSVGLFSFLSDVVAVPAYPAKLATDCGCFVVNFLVMRSYVFHQRRGIIAWLSTPFSKVSKHDGA